MTNNATGVYVLIRSIFEH